MNWRVALAAVVGYLVGLFPTAQTVAGWLTRGELDPLEVGSRNPGAANVTRSVGRTAGGLVLVGDVGKAVIAGRLGGAIAGAGGLHAAATGSVLGHCFPVTRMGSGGKGVATSIGQVVVSFPAYLPIDMAVAGAAYYLGPLRRDPRLATAVASVSWMGCGVLWWRRRLPNLWGPPPSAALAVGAVVSSTAIAVRFAQRSPDPDQPEEPSA